MNQPISGNYKIIASPNLRRLERKYSAAWQNQNLPEMQYELVKEALKNVKDNPPMTTVISLFRNLSLENPTVLEVGCATGYYSDVFSKARIRVKYSGCDYSEAFIDKARVLHPKIKFKVCDATALDYDDNEFAVVLSGGCLVHIVDFPKAIAESARVAKNYVVFHRTAILHQAKTTFTKKVGYGLPMLEIFFNEERIAALFRANNLAVTAVRTYASFPVPGLPEPVFMKSYLCQKY